MIRHRYRVAAVAFKANIVLQQLVLEHAEDVRAGRATVGGPNVDPAEPQPET